MTGGVGAGEDVSELGQSASEAGFDGADGHFQHIGNFLVRTILQVEKRDRRAIDLIHLAQGLHRLHGVQLAGGLREDDRQIGIRFRQFGMREAGQGAAGFQEGAIAGW